jgi:rSAM/selenodomain-associated transferase 2
MTPPAILDRGGLTVVVPTLNEASALPATLATIRAALPAAALTVCDGGSIDGTPALAAAGGAQVLAAPRGRGRQLAAGAAATDSTWLLFLHADTRLPPDTADALAAFAAAGGPPVATFGLRFDGGGRFLAACAWAARFDSVFTRFGDQGIVVSRAAYEELGGFPPWPLFEDVEFLRRARRRYGRVAALPVAVTTSARRFHREPWRQQARNASLLIRFLLGASPEKLALRYAPAASFESVLRR